MLDLFGREIVDDLPRAKGFPPAVKTPEIKTQISAELSRPFVPYSIHKESPLKTWIFNQHTK